MSEHLAIVIWGGVATFLLVSAAVFIHERRESRERRAAEARAEKREKAAQDRHDQVNKKMDDLIHITRGAIDQRNSQATDIEDLRAVVEDLADLHAEAHPEARPARRPRIR